MKLLSIITNKIIKKITKSDNLYSSEIGDIIWCRRYKTEEEKTKTKVGHREGPFIVIYKEKKCTYGLFCTSKKINAKWHHRYMELDKNDYYFDRNCYIHTTFNETITKEQYKHKIGKLNPEDLNTLLKKLYIITHSNCDTSNLTINKDNLKFTYTKGDIIIYENKLYYIENISHNYFITFNITRTKDTSEKNHIFINNNWYHFNFNKLEKIALSKKVQLLDFADITKIISIETKYNKHLTASNPDNIIKRGSLIQANNNLYYIFAEYKSNWLTFKVYTKKEKGTNEITINNEKYYVNYSEVELKKSNNLILLHQASEYDIKNIIAKRRSLNNVKKKPQTLNVNIKEKHIIIDRTTLDRYLVINRTKDTLHCIALTKPIGPQEINLKKNYSFTVERTVDNIEYQSIKLKLEQKS